MKKTLLLSLSLAVFGSLASASLISCTVAGGTGYTGYTTGTADINGSFANTGVSIANGGPLASTAVFSCPALNAGAGNIITNFQLFGTGDYTGGPFGTTSGTQVTLVFSANAGPFNGATQTLMVSGGNSSNTFNPTTPFQLGSTAGGLQSYSAFTVNLSSTVNSGTVGASTAQVVFSYTTAPVGETPEPATLGLMGSALIGLGFLARRKK